MIRYFLALLFVTTLFAEGKTPAALTMPPQLSLASPDFTYEVSFDALIVQPFAGNVDYGAEAVPFDYGDGAPVLSPSWVIPNISSDFHFGFDIGFQGVFHSAKTNLMADWEWAHTGYDTSTFAVSNASFMFGPFFEIGPDASVYKQATSQVRYEFDAVHLDYGIFLRLGSRLFTNLYSGLGWARINQQLSTTFSNFENSITRTIDVPATFMGAGPEIGMTFNYDVAGNFSFNGRAKTLLLVGNYTNQTNFSTSSGALAALNANPSVQSTTANKLSGVVPALEGRLGFNYETTSFCGKYLIKLEAGYLAQVFINAIRSLDIGSEVTLAEAGSIGSATTGVYARTFKRTTTDFGLAGPYVTLDIAY